MLQIFKLPPLEEIVQGGIQVPAADVQRICDFKSGSPSSAHKFVTSAADVLPLNVGIVNRVSGPLTASLYGATSVATAG